MSEHDELSLENLAMPAGFYDPKAMAEIKELHEKYSQMTCEELMATLPKYSVSMKTVNEHIYDGYVVSGMGTGIPRLRRMQLDRMKSLFGLPDDPACYAWLRAHGSHSDEARDALLSDAFRTGKWEELPDALQDEYHAERGTES